MAGVLFYMGFQTETTEAFGEIVSILQEDAPDSCWLRYPVNANGTDMTGAQSYRAIAAPSPDRLELTDGGFREEYQFTVTMLRADFPVLPISGERFKMGGRVRRITQVDTVEASGILLLTATTVQK